MKMCSFYWSLPLASEPWWWHLRVCWLSSLPSSSTLYMMWSRSLDIGGSVLCSAVSSGQVPPISMFLEYWISNLLALVGLFLITSTNTYLAISGVFGLKTFLLMWITGMVAMAITWTSLYYIWVHLLHLVYPMPLIGLFNFVAGFVAEVIVLYFQIPKGRIH